VVGLARRDRRTPPEWRRAPRPGDILALGLAQQAIGLAGLPRQPSRVGLDDLKRHVDHRPPAPAKVKIRGPVAIAAAVRRTRIPFVERHRKPSDGESTGYP